MYAFRFSMLLKQIHTVQPFFFFRKKNETWVCVAFISLPKDYIYRLILYLVKENQDFHVKINVDIL